MYIKRKIEKELLELKLQNKAVLMLGARQVGKTYIIKKFIENNYKKIYYLNLYNNIDAVESIIKASDYENFLLRLSAFSDVIIDKDTGIFIDEIEEYYNYLNKHKEIDKYYDVITAAKFLQEAGYHIYFSGSLLRLEMDRVISYPLGYMVKLELFPLDFEEFMIANGINEQWINILRDCFNEKKEVPDFIHDKISKLFKMYLIVGGMPDAVYQYITFNSLKAVENAHKSINDYIMLDIIRYASDNEKLKIMEIYNLVPTELNSMSKRFILSHIPEHNKNDNEFLSFSWLNKAGVTIPVYVCEEPVVPLKISSKRNKLKLFLEDVGLLMYLVTDIHTRLKLLDEEISINYGAFYENVCASLLRCHGYDQLYYYDNKKLGEVDFLLEHVGEVSLIEIKSGKNYLRHRAINNLLNTKNYSFKNSFVFYDGNVFIKDNITYLPTYLIEFIRK